MWWAVYVVCLLALFVRVSAVPPEARAPLYPAPGEPLGLIAWHHRAFYVLLVAAVPLEALLLGGAEAGRVWGAIAFAAGVGLYRYAGAALGTSLSPLVSPRPGGGLVTEGPYALIRHPMYLGQALIAFGAPLTLGCRWSLGLAVVALVLLLRRMAVEDAWLERSRPDHAAYRRRVKRWIPFVF